MLNDIETVEKMRLNLYGMEASKIVSLGQQGDGVRLRQSC